MLLLRHVFKKSFLSLITRSRIDSVSFEAFIYNCVEDQHRDYDIIIFSIQMYYPFQFSAVG